jgi:dihydrodipicolinate synthase/N-acetylneuraminate lyase
MRTPPNVMPAVITPFTADGELHEPAHRHNLAALHARGCGGFLVAGSTGEGPYLETGERRCLLSAARDELGNDPFLLAGISGESVRQALAQIAEGVEGGADAVLVVTPTSMARGNHAAVVQYYLDVATASPLPVYLYSVPRVTGYEIPVDAVVTLASHPNIFGMKDSGARPVRIKEIARSLDDPFLMFAGASIALAPSMAAGGYGAINASGNYASELIAELVAASAVLQADAEALQARLTAIVKEVESYGLPGTKAAANARGLHAGFPRRPLLPLNADDAAAVAAVVAGLEDG